MIGVYNHLLSKVSRFHYQCQKVIGFVGPGGSGWNSDQRWNGIHIYKRPMQGGDKNSHQLCHLLRVTRLIYTHLWTRDYLLSYWWYFGPAFSIMLHGVSYPEVFPKIGVPQNGWFIIREKPIENGWFGGTNHFWKHPYRGEVIKWNTPRKLTNEQFHPTVANGSGRSTSKFPPLFWDKTNLTTPSPGPETHWSGVVSFIGTFLLVGAMVFTKTLPGDPGNKQQVMCPWTLKMVF